MVNGKSHFEWILDEDESYGTSTTHFGFLGLYSLNAANVSANDTTIHPTNSSARQMIVSNMKIFEKFDHLVNYEWYVDYLKGAEYRLDSKSVISTLEENLGDIFVSG